jgi:2-keto-4-pentenoate hydratase/2-oxohepta-3-ene-1,7-dioic acid hydratase in catechol pathway
MMDEHTRIGLRRSMRLVTYDSGSGPRAGVLDGDHVVDVWGEAPVRQADLSLAGLLRGGLIDEIEPEGEPVPLADVRLLPPVPDPDKIICIGLNYRAHAAEAGIDPPEVPTFFAKFRNALAGAGAEVALPESSAKVDYEAEVAFVVGRRAKDVGEDRALEHLAGYMLLNDLSARDLQFATPQWMPGKVFDGAAPCGPYLVTPDEAGPADALGLELTLNGETMQSATTADLIHSIPRLVAHLSALMTLEPGDIVSTGTPAGVGSVRRPRVWLKPGDEVVITSPTLGRLETRLT